MIRPHRKTDALNQRDQLEQEQVNLRVRLADLDVEERDLRTTSATLRDEMARADVAATRRGEQTTRGDIDRHHAAQHQIEQRLADVAYSRRALQRAEAKIPGQIEQLHRDQWEAFAAHAEETTETARQALAVLEDAYRRAWAAWQEGTAAWQRPMADLDEQADADDLGARFGHTAGNSPRTVPPWPLPHPDEVFAGGAPRPLPYGYYTADERRRLKLAPGWYVDTANGSLHQLDDAGAVRSNRHLIQPDRRGFARWRRQGAVAG